MMKRLLAPVLALSLLVHSAWAANCSSYPFTLTNGTTADANQVMSNFNSILACANTLANAPVNTNITQLTGLTSPITPALGGTSVYNSSSATVGSANAQQLSSVTPSAYSLVTGNMVLFQVGAGLTNTAATQLSVNGTAFTNILKRTAGGLQTLVAGDLVAGQFYMVGYDGTQYELLTPQASGGAIGTVASAATTTIGIANNVVQITGSTTITSFGSAGAGGDVKFLLFAGSLTLTYNATSLILPGANNIQTAANDAALALYLGSGNWQVLAYFPASPFNTQVFGGSGTYNAPGGASFIIISGCGAGGAGGGTPTTSGTQAAVGGAGTGGSYGSWIITAGFTGGIAVTIGAGGVGVANGNGNAGGNTTFGSILTLPGGNGGLVSTALAPPFYHPSAVNPATPTFSGTGTLIFSGAGKPGQAGIALATSSAFSGNGGDSPWGTGGIATSGPASGNQGTGFCTGGSGSAVTASTGATAAGGTGTGGLLIITAYP